MPASAGFGNFLEENPDADDYETTNQDCTFAVRIEGDSMEPDVHNGISFWLKHAMSLKMREKALYGMMESVTVKRLFKVKKESFLFLQIQATDLFRLYLWTIIVCLAK